MKYRNSKKEKRRKKEQKKVNKANTPVRVCV